MHMPLKVNKIRGNPIPFMSKELSKAIMERSKAKNKYNRYKSRENYLGFQIAKQKCKKCTADAKSAYFKQKNFKWYYFKQRFMETCPAHDVGERWRQR